MLQRYNNFIKKQQRFNKNDKKNYKNNLSEPQKINIDQLFNLVSLIIMFDKRLFRNETHTIWLMPRSYG